ncbi:MAG: hypothetical protein J07HX64_00406 [halophilic archaeon J07HX64]|nr:MAG: hypothetical protein J07HX64_00406 [halophilic archaeon J07HX64]
MVKLSPQGTTEGERGQRETVDSSWLSES